MPESAEPMSIYLPKDLQNAQPYFKQKLRKIVCLPLDTLSDEYLHKQGWNVEAIFPPIPGLALDAPAKENSLIVVVRKAKRA
jgi:hypothetical protein